jgi:acetolactate synthase-1/2/3 large subunit
MTTGCDFILDALAQEGLTHLFLVPGGLVDPFLPALARQEKLQPVVAAHEGGAAYMADGYARASGRFGAALGIGGPGLCNMATAVAAAKTDFSPLLVMSGEVPVDMEGLGAFQDASQATLDDTAVMKPLTRLSVTAASPRSLHHWLSHALTAMWSHPLGPVHLSLTQDVLTGACAAKYTPVFDFFSRLAPLDASAALRVFESVGQAARPRMVFLAGAGVEHDEAAFLLRAAAERWSIPVAATLRAKGVFPEDHELSLGVFGYAGTRHATAAVLGRKADVIKADVIIVLGSGFNERDTMHWSLRGQAEAGTAVIHVNTAMSELTAHSTPAHAVSGSCLAFLELMLKKAEALVPSLNNGIAERRAWLAGIKKEPRLYSAKESDADGQRIHPAAAVKALRKVFPRDGILLVDSGAHRAFAGHYWEAYEPRSYISATNLGPMGWAIPAAIGVQCARPNHRVAVITGDGCMQMHGIEVQTAARYSLPIVFVVLNNAALGNVWLRAREYGPLPAELTRIPDHDWAGFGEALGARGFTVRNSSELESVFAQALAANGPAVVDVKTEKDCPTPVYDFIAGKRAWTYHE